jgi:hypothetical protein
MSVSFAAARAFVRRKAKEVPPSAGRGVGT